MPKSFLEVEFNNMERNYHQSVLLEEVLDSLSVERNEIYLDATFGGGGHTQGILNLGGKVIALDIDKCASVNAKKKYKLIEKKGVWVTDNGNLKIYRSNFKDLDLIAKKEKIKGFSGVIYDLGVSSYMFDEAKRGFSFSKPGPLDMRMDQDLTVTASDLLNVLNEGELYELFSKLGQEPYARSIARDVVRYRLTKQFKSTLELADLVRSKYKYSKKGSDPSTRVFMALRIAVNDELNNLKESLPKASKFLKKNGRLVVISFHSLEDRIVKDYLKNDPSLEVLGKKPIIASPSEVKLNPRSASAKMRVALKK